MNNQGSSNNNKKSNKFSNVVLSQLLKRLKKAPRSNNSELKDVKFLATEITLENEFSIEEELASEKVKEFRKKYSKGYSESRKLTVYDFLSMNTPTSVIQ